MNLTAQFPAQAGIQQVSTGSPLARGRADQPENARQPIKTTASLLAGLHLHHVAAVAFHHHGAAAGR